MSTYPVYDPFLRRMVNRQHEQNTDVATVIDYETVHTPYTLRAADNGKKIHMNNGAIFLPQNMIAGFNAVIVNIGTGSTVIAAPGCTLRSKGGNTRISSQYGAVTADHIGDNVWHLIGDLS